MNTIEDIEFATAYTSGVHAGQLRKGTDTPYIEHPLAVAGLVNEYRGDNDQFTAALLHDTRTVGCFLYFPTGA
jgi:(p)ppGpp synthase/HD superfamily hydrolase